MRKLSNLSIKGLNKLFISNKRNLSQYSYIKSSDCSNYQEMKPIYPDNQLNKFFCKYILLNNKNLLLNELELKKDSMKKYDTITITEKFSGFIEYKIQLKQILEVIFLNICKLNEKEGNLEEITEYYFKMDGKMIRPHFLILLSKYLNECTGVKKEKDIINFAACIEALHNASLLQDDIIDNSSTRRNMSTAHSLYGLRPTLFSSNFILSKAASLIADIEHPHLNEIYSNIVFDLIYGEFQQTINRPFIYKDDFESINKNLERYMIKTYYKTASLIALGFRGVAILNDLDFDKQKLIFEFGLHLGILFQLVDDILDVKQTSLNAKKPTFKDIEEGIINTHVIYDMYGSEILVDKFKNKTYLNNKEELSLIKQLILNGSGIIKAENLAFDHLSESLNILNNPFFVNSLLKQKLIKSIYFMYNRNY